MPSRICCALLFTLLLTPAVFAQDAPSRPSAEFEGLVEVGEVLLDVLVTDKEGNVILGLGPGDFKVEEDGKPVEVTGATFYSNRRFLEGADAAQLAGVDPDDVPVDRYFILFFHDQRQDYPQLTSQQLDLGRYAKLWAREQLAPNDWVAVASYDVKLKVQQDFTRDVEAIVRGIDAAVQGKDRDSWPSRQQALAEGPSLLAHLSQGKALRKETWTLYHGLQVLAEAAGHVRARKNLLMFSIGFGEVNAAGFYTPDQRYYPSMVQALNDNNVAVYAIDLLPTSEGGNIFARTLNDSLSQLADDTGGRFYRQFITFATPLKQVAEDNNGYYLLSFRTEHAAGEEKYRKVEVEARNPEFRVRARQGYLAGS